MMKKMNTTQETSVTSTQDRCSTPVQVLKKGLKIIGEAKAEIDGTKSTVEDLFPWITEFKKKCRSSLSQPNIVALIKLMKFYARNVSINVNECYTKPYRAAKLKDSISETLLFFLFYFRELLEVCDKNSYLDKMSDVLAMYLDMELKASRRGKEHHTKISARLTSCLYVYLENSTEHILDTFIKAKFINRNYHDILEPVLNKITKTITTPPNCDTMYIRYLLIYRLWKKVNNDAAVKNEINATAILHLGPPPPSPTPFLAKYVLPKVPKSQANSTKFLLMHKFDIEKSCRLFIQYCKENREDEDHGDLDKPNSIAVPDTSLEMLGGSAMICRGTNQAENLVDNVNILARGERHQNNSVKTNNNNNSESLPVKCNNQESMKLQQINIAKLETGDTISKLKPPLRSSKVISRLKTKKNGDILFIDLTEDEITEKVIKKKKHRKLHWLTEIKKRLNTKNIKASDKKKKAEIVSEDSIDDLKLSGLVDSTSARSLSTATTPEPSVCLENDFEKVRSTSIVTSPEPDNFVTSNSKENELPLDLKSSNNEISEFVEKQIDNDVTTTVTESVSQSVIPSSDQTSNPTTISVTELSNALSRISESYDSDSNSAKERDKPLSEIGETDLVKDENIPVEREEVLDNTEAEEDLEKMQRTLSESSDVAVIFTRRASDVEIVDLDEYTETCESEKFNEIIQKVDGDVKNLTLRTDKLELDSNETIEVRNGNLEAKDFNTQLKYSEKLIPSCDDILKQCDDEASGVERSVVVELSPSDDLEIAKKITARLENSCKESSIIENGYVQDETLIPKINEILISTKNNLLTNQESQFNDNIDGLSLLASVSQHVSHLEEFTDKSLSEPKIISGVDFEEKNVAELRNELLNFTKTQTNDVAIRRSVKVKKLANDISKNAVPLSLETTVDLDSVKLQNNLLSVKNVTQMIKESPNVIVNGETVVLFQKSPNSNLYIINKAGDGSMEYLNDDKNNVTKTIKRNSTTMRDIINHMPINQDDVKNHNRNKTSAASSVIKTKTDLKKVVNSVNKYEKQLKIMRDEFSQYNDDKIDKECIKKEIKTDCYEDNFVKRFTDTPGSVVELETVKKSPPPVIRITDNPLDVGIYCRESNSLTNITTTGRWNGTKNQGTYKQNFKEELINCNNDDNYSVKQNHFNNNASNFYPVNEIQNVYTSLTSTTNNLYSIDPSSSKVSCSSSPLLQSYDNIAPSLIEKCQLSRCACIKCAYDLRCAPVNVSRSSYLETESYFFHNDIFTCDQSNVDKSKLKLNEIALAKLNDDQLLRNIEKSILDNKKEVKETKVDETVREIKYKPEFENKLPLKKRIKAHAMLSMNFNDPPATSPLSIKIEKVESYPGTPMMSIAALEARNVGENPSDIYDDKSTAQSSPKIKDDVLSNHAREMIRRDYLKDSYLTSIGNCANVDERVRKFEQQKRQTNSHVNIMATGCQRSFQTPAQRNEAITSSSQISVKRPATSVADYPKNAKKAKKTKAVANNRQTRSSTRNIPKVDYSYDRVVDNDFKLNSSSESKRKRKKTSR